MHLPAIFQTNNSKGMLSKPGDMMTARITPSGRKVIKIITNNGNNKYSATQYSTGTVVETRSIKRKS